MKKSDLKTGMLVQYRNGQVRMVINGHFIGEGNYLDFDCNPDFQEDLSWKSRYDLDIVKVSSVLSLSNLIPKKWNLETLDRNLLWERDPEKKYIIDGVEYSERNWIKSLIKKATK